MSDLSLVCFARLDRSKVPERWGKVSSSFVNDVKHDRHEKVRGPAVLLPDTLSLAAKPGC